MNELKISIPLQLEVPRKSRPMPKVGNSSFIPQPRRRVFPDRHFYPESFRKTSRVPWKCIMRIQSIFLRIIKNLSDCFLSWTFSFMSYRINIIILIHWFAFLWKHSFILNIRWFFKSKDFLVCSENCIIANPFVSNLKRNTFSRHVLAEFNIFFLDQTRFRSQTNHI